MKRDIWIKRDKYGACIKASFRFIEHAYYHQVGTTKQITQLLMHDDTSDRLFQACWKEAAHDAAIDLSRPLTVDMDDQEIEYCMQDARELDAYASAKVNNERSSFYIHGR